MPTKFLREPEHINMLADLLRGLKLPLTISWTAGAPRTPPQNRLAQRWFSDIARQLGDRSHENVRAECKLRFGVPILREESEAFRAIYDRVLKERGYEEKVEAIEVFDLPVTRLMSVPQMKKFMSEMQRFWLEKGVYLTDPAALKYEEEFKNEAAS